MINLSKDIKFTSANFNTADILRELTCILYNGEVLLLPSRISNDRSTSTGSNWYEVKCGLESWSKWSNAGTVGSIWLSESISAPAKSMLAVKSTKVEVRLILDIKLCVIDMENKRLVCVVWNNWINYSYSKMFICSFSYLIMKQLIWNGTLWRFTKLFFCKFNYTNIRNRLRLCVKLGMSVED